MALFEKQSMMDDGPERLKLVYEIDKKLQEDAARPIIANNVRYNCFQPHVKGFKTMTNSLYNGWRFEDIYLDIYAFCHSKLDNWANTKKYWPSAILKLKRINVEVIFLKE